MSKLQSPDYMTGMFKFLDELVHLYRYEALNKTLTIHTSCRITVFHASKDFSSFNFVER